jgi:hypothetical protein
MVKINEDRAQRSTVRMIVMASAQAIGKHREAD